MINRATATGSSSGTNHPIRIASAADRRCRGQENDLTEQIRQVMGQRPETSLGNAVELAQEDAAGRAIMEEAERQASLQGADHTLNAVAILLTFEAPTPESRLNEALTRHFKRTGALRALAKDVDGSAIADPLSVEDVSQLHVGSAAKLAERMAARPGVLTRTEAGLWTKDAPLRLSQSFVRFVVVSGQRQASARALTLLTPDLSGLQPCQAEAFTSDSLFQTLNAGAEAQQLCRLRALMQGGAGWRNPAVAVIGGKAVHSASLVLQRHRMRIGYRLHVHAGECEDALRSRVTDQLRQAGASDSPVARFKGHLPAVLPL